MISCIVCYVVLPFKHTWKKYIWAMPHGKNNSTGNPDSNIVCRSYVIVGGQYCFARWRLASSGGVCRSICRRRCLSVSVSFRGGPASGFTHACQAMTSYRSTVTLHGGPVVLRPVRAIPCFTYCTPSLVICIFLSCFKTWLQIYVFNIL